MRRYTQKNWLLALLLGSATLSLSACQNHSPSHAYAYAQPNGHGHYRAAPTPPPYPVRARGVDVNYETFSTFEAPLAVDMGGTTLLLRGRADLPVSYSFESGDRIERKPVLNGQISLERQLRNRITVGAVYGGQFDRTGGRLRDYEDDVALFVGGSWGTVFGGNVSDLVEEETRRARSVVPEQLRGGGPIGKLGEWSGGYRGRYGPVIVGAVIDEEGNYDIGASVQRPIGVRDYRFTARHNQGTMIAADGVTKLDTRSVSGVAEYVYGSSRFDIGAGLEQVEDTDRWYAAAGAATKIGAWSLSAEGQYGQFGGEDEVSGLIGIRRDLARGLSASVATEYFDRQVTVAGTDYLDNKDTRVTATLSYGF